MARYKVLSAIQHNGKLYLPEKYDKPYHTLRDPDGKPVSKYDGGHHHEALLSSMNMEEMKAGKKRTTARDIPSIIELSDEEAKQLAHAVELLPEDRKPFKDEKKV